MVLSSLRLPRYQRRPNLVGDRSLHQSSSQHATPGKAVDATEPATDSSAHSTSQTARRTPDSSNRGWTSFADWTATNSYTNLPDLDPSHHRRTVSSGSGLHPLLERVSCDPKVALAAQSVVQAPATGAVGDDIGHGCDLDAKDAGLIGVLPAPVGNAFLQNCELCASLLHLCPYHKVRYRY